MLNDKSFNNKSEERRYKRLSSIILKLKHVLINDAENSHFYILKFLKNYYTLEEIKHFTDDMLKNFINGVVMFKDVNPNLSMKEFVTMLLHGKDYRSREPSPSSPTRTH